MFIAVEQILCRIVKMAQKEKFLTIFDAIVIS